MENFDNIDTRFVKLICAYVKDIQKINTDDLDDKLAPDSAIIKFLESRTLIHKSIKHRKENYVEIDVIFSELPDFLFTITDNKILSPNTKDEAFWDWYENNKTCPEDQDQDFLSHYSLARANPERLLHEHP